MLGVTRPSRGKPPAVLQDVGHKRGNVTEDPDCWRHADANPDVSEELRWGQLTEGREHMSDRLCSRSLPTWYAPPC